MSQKSETVSNISAELGKNVSASAKFNATLTAVKIEGGSKVRAEVSSLHKKL